MFRLLFSFFTLSCTMNASATNGTSCIRHPAFLRFFVCQQRAHSTNAIRLFLFHRFHASRVGKRQNKTKTNSHSEFRRKRFQFELLRLRASWQLVVGLFWPKNFQLQREAISDLIDWFYNSSDSGPHLFFARCDVRMGHRLVMSSQLTARILIDLKLAATPIYKFNNNANYMSFPSPVSW